MANRSGPTRPGRTAVRAALALVMAGVLTGCESAVEQGEQDGGAAECQDGGTLVAAAAQPPVPERVLAQGAANFYWLPAVFEPLLNVEGNNLAEVTPVLATDFEVADDDLSVTLQLRDDVTFHSGRPFTSADVLFTLEQAMTPASPSDVKSILAQWQVEAIGEHEVMIRSQNPLSPVIGGVLALTAIVDSETYAGVEDGSMLIGTGPFKVESYQPGTEMVLTRNEDYWQEGQPVLDRIENVAIPDSTAQLSALQSGRAQLAGGMTTQDALTVTEGGQFEIYEGGKVVYSLVLETRSGVFTNKAVRQAVGYAIDRERINAQVFGGLAKATDLHWAEETEGYPADLENQYTFDLDRARQMIEEAGATGARVPIMFLNNPVLQAEYEIIANTLTEVGLRPSPSALPAPEYQERLASGTGGNYLAFRGQNGTASFMLQTNADLRLEGAHRQFTTPEYTDLVNQVVASGGGEQGAEALSNLTEYMLDEAFMHVLVQTPRVQVRSTSLENITWTLGGLQPNETCLTQ